MCGSQYPKFCLTKFYEQIYEGHAHYIMNLVFNPQDPSSFLSSSIDGSVKLWSAGSSSPKFSLQAHEQGVNYVDFYPGADKPYLVTASDDKTVKVWDYRSKSCVHVLEGHASKVSFAVFHPNLPIIISGSEDGTVKIWNLGDYHAESSLNYGLERSWCVALHKHSNEVAVGFDAGVVVLKVRILIEKLLSQVNSSNLVRRLRGPSCQMSLMFITMKCFCLKRDCVWWSPHNYDEFLYCTCM